MGGTTLHVGIVAQWFEVLLLFGFFEDILLWSSMGFYLV